MREDVEFPGFGGVTLRGWLYRPAGEAGAAPAIVMAHGFSATRHMALAGFAEVFCAAGIAVLVYDHRNLGDSDGEPRQEINPWAQARDYRYALSWLVAQPGIAPERLAIWGSSFSGGEVLVVGAVDPRVKVVVANVPFAGLLEDPSSPLDERFAALRAALEDENGSGPADSTEPPIGPLPVILASGSEPGGRAFLPQPESTEWFEAAGGPGTAWQNTFTLKGMRSDPPFVPAVAVPFIAPRALLMVVASGDRVAPAEMALAAYELAGEPKQLELVDGDHFVPYSGAAMEHAAAVMRDFLLAHL
jgi:fermentation-respiration switch protein FrsA (DUF1100 family)